MREKSYYWGKNKYLVAPPPPGGEGDREGYYIAGFPGGGATMRENLLHYTVTCVFMVFN